MANTLDKIEEGILNIYAENLVEGVELETIKEMVNNETWLTGEEASKYFNIEVSNPVEAVACASDYFEKYNKVPKNISNENVTRATEENVEDVTRATVEETKEDVTRATSENEVAANINNETEKDMLLMELDLI